MLKWNSFAATQTASFVNEKRNLQLTPGEFSTNATFDDKIQIPYRGVASSVRTAEEEYSANAWTKDEG